METTAVRLHGANDVRLGRFCLPAMRDDEIAAHIISDSICMSTYKAAVQGAAHKRVPDNLESSPVIVGHEFCGEISAVGDKWKDLYRVGQRFSIQPALNENGSLAAPGYSFPFFGGDATDVIIPNCVMALGCLLPYDGDAFFKGSLAEPVSCIIGGFHTCYHTADTSYAHEMGIRDGGRMAILAGAGPMGLGAIDYALHGPRRPSLLLVTDIDPLRLRRAEELYPVQAAADCGVHLVYRNTKEGGNTPSELRTLCGGDGFDDVFVLAPVPAVVEFADALLRRDGCINFFSGPLSPDFSARFNFYNVHYLGTHAVGNSGGTTADMKEALALMAAGKINPSAMITHIGGLDAVSDTVLRLPQIPGGKKLIYTNISMPLTALDSLRADDDDPLRAALCDILKANRGLWCKEAEDYLLAHAAPISRAEISNER